MANVKAKSSSKRLGAKETLPFTKQNYFLFALGIGVIILGYIALAQGPADSFSSRTLAPILLVIGYCVVIPVSIMYRKKANK